MINSRPQPRKKRRSRPWHRVLGLLTVLPLLWVTLTGMLLNHSVDWKLDQMELDHPWILAAYGMTPDGVPRGLSVSNHKVTEWDGQIFHNTSPLDITGRLVGAVPDGHGLAVVTREAVLRLDAEGNPIETLDEITLPRLPIEAVDFHNGRTLLLNAEGWHTVINEWTEFSRTDFSPTSRQQPAPVSDSAFKSSLVAAWAQGGLPASRIVLDLHAARFLGPFAKYFYDVVGLCTLMLCASGLRLFWRQSGRKG